MTSRTCPACGRYCYRRCRHCGYHRPTKPVPDHRRKIVMGVRVNALGVREFKTMSSRKAAIVLGGQKRGLAVQASGRAHRWTSETARKAAIKSWTKRRKFNKRIGARVGMKANKRKALWRPPLREYYAENPTRGIRYDPQLGGWYSSRGMWDESTPLGCRFDRLISERAALTALGHLASSRGFIPDSITPVPRTGNSREKKDR